MHFGGVYVLILDGMGVGQAPDAARYGDEGSDTLAHVLTAARCELPVLARLGLGNLYVQPLPGLPRAARPEALCCRLTETSAGKDSTTGHWELLGVVRTEPAPVFPSGFPADFLSEFSERVGRGVLGNRPASGTAIIAELGAEHLATGSLIVYTSADSVFQIAAHVDRVPLSELYRSCETARAMLTGSLAVDRVIARPFTGNAESGFSRTADRRDYSLEPPEPTVLDELCAAGLDVIGVGKIEDLFAGRGLTRSLPVHGNRELMLQVSELARARREGSHSAEQPWRGLVICNLVDFDMLYGHRNNPAGYGEALTAFDRWLGGFLGGMREDELLLITADHGNDPTTPSTDHSREQVPLLLAGPAIRARGGGGVLDPPPGFHHVGATVAAALGIATRRPGLDLLDAGMEVTQ